jgi:hypothetical protein
MLSMGHEESHGGVFAFNGRKAPEALRYRSAQDRSRPQRTVVL